MPCFPRSATDCMKATSFPPHNSTNGSATLAPDVRGEPRGTVRGPGLAPKKGGDHGPSRGPADAGGRRGRGSPRAAERGPPPQRGVGAALSTVLKGGEALSAVLKGGEAP